MPRITEYRSTEPTQVITAYPRDRSHPSDMGTDVGAGLESIGHATGQVADLLYQRQVEAETSDIHARFAAHRAALTNYLNDSLDTATPGDMSFAYKFNEQVSKTLDAGSDAVQTRHGQQLYRNLSAQLQGDLAQRAALGQAHLAGQKAVLDKQTMLNQWGNTLSTDPTQFERSLTETEAAIRSDTRLPKLEQEKLISQAHQDLARGTVFGIIKQAGGEIAKDRLNNDVLLNKYLDDKTKQVLLGMADTAIDHKRAQEEHAMMVAEHQLKLRRDTEMQGLFHQFRLFKLDVPTIDDNTVISFEQKHVLADMVKTQTKELREPFNTDPDVFFKAVEDIRAGKVADKNSLAQLYNLRSVKWDDVEKLQKEWDEVQTSDGRNLAKEKAELLIAAGPKLDKTFLPYFIDRDGKLNLLMFHDFMNQQIQAKRDAKKDPHVLFDSSSPEWLGNRIDSFKTPIKIQPPKFEEQVTPVPPGTTVPSTKAARPGAVIAAPPSQPLPAPKGKTEPAMPSNQPSNTKLGPGRQPGESPQEYIERAKREGFYKWPGQR
jgi:hypothetical protein